MEMILILSLDSVLVSYVIYICKTYKTRLSKAMETPSPILPQRQRQTVSNIVYDCVSQINTEYAG